METPLLRWIKKFGYAITAVIGVVSVIVFMFGRWVREMPFIDIFQAVVSIAISAIPEGLPALITVTLAIGVLRLAHRHPPSSGASRSWGPLGSVSHICSDKTGTLTLMEMMVVSAVTAGISFPSDRPRLCRGRARSCRTEEAAGNDPVLTLVGRVSMLCNDAELVRQEGVWKVEGDPTEGALYPFATKLGLERQAEQATYPRIDVIPFESEHKFMATLHQDVAGKRCCWSRAP